MLHFKAKMHQIRFRLGFRPRTCYRGSTTAPEFSRSSPAGGSAISAQHVRPSGIRCRRPDDLQRSARWAARPHRQYNFQTTFKDTFFSSYLHV